MGAEKRRRTRRPRQVAAAAVAAAAVAAAAVSAGCGDTEDRSAAQAKTATVARPDRFAYARRLFREICGSCHTLADAGTTGDRFNLDTESPIVNYLRTERDKRRLARWAIEEGEGEGMPAFRGPLTRREIDALVTYIVAVAGKGGE